MSTAVLVSGQMRTAKECAPSILQAFPDADFYVHAVADEDAESAECFNPVRLCIEPQHEMPERREYTWQLGRGCHGVQRVLKQLWGLDRVYSLFEGAGKEYDWIVRCRPDIQFSVMPEAESERNKNRSYFPAFCNYYGLNDRFAMLNGKPWARQYFTRIKKLDLYIDGRGMFHPETFLAWCMCAPFNHNRTKSVFDTVRKDGTRDKPEWKKEYGDILP